MRIIRKVRGEKGGYLSVSVPKDAGIEKGDMVEIIKIDDTATRRVGGSKPFPPFPPMRP